MNTVNSLVSPQGGLIVFQHLKAYNGGGLNTERGLNIYFVIKNYLQW